MNIIEIRDLDGPNLFLPGPAIKLEVEVPEGEPLRIAGDNGEVATASPTAMMDRLSAIIGQLHQESGVAAPSMTTREMEAPGHYVVAFSWERRRFARALAKAAFKLVSGERNEQPAVVDELWAILASEPDEDDAPEMVPTSRRTLPIITITGTNGKTTTSRVLSFALRHAGKKVGMTSSSGVYIDTEQVISGDYSGPAGAQRVFREPGVDVGVLETARGGMLLRGLAFESGDVGVVTNVSEDHLGLHGVYSVEKLAEVKSLVVKYLRPDGFAVLNADDPRVLAMMEVTPARPFLVTRRPVTPEIQAHIDTGGWALTVSENLDVIWWHDGQRHTLTTLNDVPMTFSGRAPHMVENALCAAAALLGIGLAPEQVRDGLAAFRNTANDNRGRLNVYEYKGGTIVLDFAHNVAGLEQLIGFGTQFCRDNGHLTAVIGTAGDRDDEVFRGLARAAARQADTVILKDSHKYLRGRELGEMLALMREGIEETGRTIPVMQADSERTASLMAFERIEPGDVVVLMCIEDYDYLIPWLDERARSIS
jgi:cyanophycin synthetase